MSPVVRRLREGTKFSGEGDEDVDGELKDCGERGGAVPADAASDCNWVPQKLQIVSPGSALPWHSGQTIDCASRAGGSLSGISVVARGPPPVSTSAVPSDSQNRSASG